MKKVILILLFIFSGTSTFADNRSPNEVLKETNLLHKYTSVNKTDFSCQVTFLNLNTESNVSVKCWLFKKWLKSKLKQVSDDEELIEETASKFKELCEIANSLGFI